MKTLRIGSTGKDVESLQLWMNSFRPCEVTGTFDTKTDLLVKYIQLNLQLNPVDGIVGPDTINKFMSEGWLPASFEQPAAKVSLYPNKPAYKALTQAQKIAKFGSPGTDAAKPTPGGPIKVNPKFSKNIIRLDLADWFPQAKVKDFGNRYLDMHKLVEEQWRKFFCGIVNEGHGDKILTCAGSWSPRYVRGSITTPSSHAYGTAVDFNAVQNWLGAQPAKAGQHGSLVEIIEIGKRYKLWSGIWFPRLDGMHLESTCTDEELGLKA